MRSDYFLFPRNVAQDDRLTYSDIKLMLAMYSEHEPGESLQMGKGDFARKSNLSYTAAKGCLGRLKEMGYITCEETGRFSCKVDLPICTDYIPVKCATTADLLEIKTASAIAMYLRIASVSNYTPIFVGLQGLREMVNIRSRSLLLDDIKELEKRGLLSVERSVSPTGRHNANCYCII